MSGELGKLTVELSANVARLQSDMGKAVQVAQNAANRIAKPLETTASKINSAFSSLPGLIGGIGLTQLTRDLVQTGLQADKINRLFVAASGSAGLGAREMEYVRQLSEKMGMSFASSAQSYGKFMAAMRGTAMEGEQGRRIFESVTKAATALGLSADETSGMFNALQQMISKGKVQAEELRGQLGERLPGAFKMAADAMGVSTAELDNMLKQGQVLATDLLPKLADQLDKTYGQAATQGASSAAAELNRLNNAMFDAKAAAGSALIPALTDIARAMVPVANTLKEIVGGLQIMSIKLPASVDRVGAWLDNRSLIARIRGRTEADYERQLKIIDDAQNGAIDDLMERYAPSGTDYTAVEKAAAAHRASVQVSNQATSSMKRHREEAEKLKLKLGEIRSLETEALEAAASFSKWSLGDLANLSPAISGPSLLGPVGDPTAAWKMSPEEMEKMAAAQRSIQEATTRQQLAAVEAMERFGQISQPDALRRKIELERQSLQYQQQALEAINQNADEGRLAWLEQAAAIDETRYRIIDLQKQLNDTTAIGGMMSAMQDYAREAQNLGVQVKDFATGVFQGMENAMVNFVKTGKMSFKDLANSIIEDLIRIAIKASITGPLTSAIGGINWGSMFSGSSAPQSGYGMSGGLLATAAGGYDIPAGINPVTQLHEREMVLPAQYADVIRSMAGGGSSAPSVIVNIENKTGQQMTAKQGGMQFDGKQFVISTIVENVENNGILRGMMAGAGAR